MRSNVCKIDKGTKDLEAILKESEKVAVYNELTHKQMLKLRLLCEEIDGMLPNIIEDFEGELYIECVDKVCSINISLSVPELNSEKRAELINVANNKQNASAVGIVGKIRNAIESFLLSEDAKSVFTVCSDSFYLSTGYVNESAYSHLWTLDKYRKAVNKDEMAESYDELERSVIASVADDVTVGVKGNRAEIIITKNFN